MPTKIALPKSRAMPTKRPAPSKGSRSARLPGDSFLRLAGSPVADLNAESFIGLLNCEQRRDFSAHHSARGHGHPQAGRGYVIGKIHGEDDVVFSEAIVKRLDLSA